MHTSIISIILLFYFRIIYMNTMCNSLSRPFGCYPPFLYIWQQIQATFDTPPFEYFSVTFTCMHSYVTNIASNKLSKIIIHHSVLHSFWIVPTHLHNMTLLMAMLQLQLSYWFSLPHTYPYFSYGWFYHHIHISYPPIQLPTSHQACIKVELWAVNCDLAKSIFNTEM